MPVMLEKRGSNCAALLIPRENASTSFNCISARVKCDHWTNSWQTCCVFLFRYALRLDHKFVSTIIIPPQTPEVPTRWRYILECETSRNNRKDLHDEDKGDNKLNKASYILKNRADVTAYQWKDNECTQPISLSRRIRCWGRRKTFYQRRRFYPLDRRFQRWRSRIFYFSLDTAIVNAFLQYTSRNNVTDMHFRLQLGRQINMRQKFR